MRVAATMRRVLSAHQHAAPASTLVASEPFTGRFDRAVFAGLKGRDFLDMTDYTPSELKTLLDVAHCLKKMYKEDGFVGHRPLVGKSIGMIFQKRSTRTRISTEVAWNMLGGHAVFLGMSDIHLGVEETAGDTARVLSKMNNAILARVYAHKDVQDMADAADIPVINALSDMAHPLQALADYMILQETFQHNLQGLNVAWVGDGNNVCHSLLVLGANLGCHLRVATPRGYEPDAAVVAHVQRVAATTGSQLLLTHDPREACANANVISTDTWVSMGDEKEQAQRLRDFAGFQVTESMGRVAHPNWKFIHCLPRKQYEVDDEVFTGPRSVVFPQAENRVWSVMAVCLGLLRGKV